MRFGRVVYMVRCLSCKVKLADLVVMDYLVQGFLDRQGVIREQSLCAILKW